jgi:hypothetical protein
VAAPNLRSVPSFGTHEHRYGILLLIILASAVFQLAAPEEDWAHLITIAFEGTTLLLAMVAAQLPRSLLRVAMGVVLVAVLGTAAALIGLGEIGDGPARIVSLVLVALAPAAIAVGVLRDVRRERAITIRTMFGVLCIYLLIGMVFAFMFGIVDELASTSFFASGAGTASDFLYFSYATLTTVGYGDLTAGTDVARSLAIAEALLGQIYLVTVVAVIVGNLGRARA